MGFSRGRIDSSSIFGEFNFVQTNITGIAFPTNLLKVMANGRFWLSTKLGCSLNVIKISLFFFWTDYGTAFLL